VDILLEEVEEVFLVVEHLVLVGVVVVVLGLLKLLMVEQELTGQVVVEVGVSLPIKVVREEMVSS
jgi:hypothetical protein